MNSMIPLMTHIELSTFALAICLGLLTWHRSVESKDNLSTMNEDCFWVYVFCNKRVRTVAEAAGFNYKDVTSIAVFVYSAAGESIGSGALAKRSVVWRGSLEVSRKGEAVFEVRALDSVGGLLCAGRTTQMLRGINDFINIPAETLRLKAESI
jgi:hypothetical protein